MRTITCNQCGIAVAIDDFIVAECPNCDSYMDPNRLDLKVEPGLSTIIRVKPVLTSALVEED